MDLEVQNEQSELSDFEYAVLEMTNDTEEWATREDKSLILTTKSAYSWAIAIVLLHRADEQLDDQKLMEAFNNVSLRDEDEIRQYYSKADAFRPPFEDQVFKSILEQLSSYLKVPIGAERAAEFAQQTLDSLQYKGLIEDPLEFLDPHTLSFAVLGLLPVGFTMITEKGRRTKLRYRSMLIDIDIEKNPKKIMINIDFRLQKLLSVVKGSLMDRLKKIIPPGN